MSEAVKTMFGRIAPKYDLANRMLSMRRDVAWRRKSLNLLQGTPGRLLDLACGTGDFGLEALSRNKATSVHGCDFCLPMLRSGDHRRDGHAFSASNGDGLRLPYADHSFEAVIMAYGWRNFDDKALGLQEMSRILKPGGEMLLLEFFTPTNLFTKAFHGAFARTAPLIGGMITGDREAYAYLHSSIQGFMTISEAQELAADNGFTNTATQSFFGGVSHALYGRTKA